jgi:hypothetical protein
MDPWLRVARFGILAVPLVYTGMLIHSRQLIWAGVVIALAAIAVRLIAALR